ncbi:hypothetical protein B0A52_08075 [Exophiala mesophila]|uniref:Nucleoporin Nup54 alpha-helical domain-containing protein n=1 Tax=Exophiala mesophila TaxID=212818 RepID=A0A438MZY3_EXOME|nr:hypothetical protein B0A52_08075 [Exophiala mesophila]
MSLFGQPQQAQQSTSSPFGGFNFGKPATQSQPQQSGGLFGASTNTQTQPQQGGGLFGASTATSSQPQQSGGLFDSTTASSQPQQPGGLFGASTNTANQPQQSGGLFGGGGGLFGASTSKPGGLFGASTQNQQPAGQQPGQAGGLFGSSTAPGLFGSSTQTTQQQPPQRPQDQVLKFGQSQQGQPQSQSLWEEGRGLNVYRSIPAQMNIVKNKWDFTNTSSPLRTYIYQHVGSETEALKYRPGPGEDEDKWEEAVSKRPGPEWVPLLVKGFFELGRKAQIQMEAIQRCNMMLQEINTSLDDQLHKHRQNVATRLEECKRRQAAAAQRTLALAVKVQILRNRGYVMDNAEEELKTKLEKLQQDILDPSLNAREQEIWARMLSIRERSKRIKAEMDRIAPAAKEEDSSLDEETTRAAKKTLEAYDIQLRHLHKELELVKEEFEDWSRISKDEANDFPRRR